jgi:hypothetical protein
LGILRPTGRASRRSETCAATEPRPAGRLPRLAILAHPAFPGIRRNGSTIGEAKWENTGVRETDIFEIRGDTMVQSITVPKGRDPDGLGCDEADFFIRVR